MRRAIGSHHSARAGSVTWLTPPPILLALGGAESFDLDPCAAPLPRPWSTARHMNALEEGDGLALRWWGRVWLNPPYTSGGLARWLRKLAEHGRGTALTGARTETEAFQRQVWERATGLLFLEGRLVFHDRRGEPARNEKGQLQNSGAPSVLCAYGEEDLERLAASALPGALVPLRLARSIVVAAFELSWSEETRAFLRRQRGPVSVSAAYRHFSRSPKAARNPHWRAKVRQKLQLVGRRVGPGLYEVA